MNLLLYSTLNLNLLKSPFYLFITIYKFVKTKLNNIWSKKNPLPKKRKRKRPS